MATAGNEKPVVGRVTAVKGAQAAGDCITVNA